ncbi:hypothetical protein CSOJ01_11034 [Colletotrichum sojae]|uniref:Uncharacterized protein n=1 Tax=Colletotrichum sojae TaxID=2175907 RepID=A0A8H6IYH2_9PEZI|nr:hypothetical protein CSOJ01_11034 [Colletotrichum sojae]
MPSKDEQPAIEQPRKTRHDFYRRRDVLYGKVSIAGGDDQTHNLSEDYDSESTSPAGSGTLVDIIDMAEKTRPRPRKLSVSRQLSNFSAPQPAREYLDPIA